MATAPLLPVGWEDEKAEVWEDEKAEGEELPLGSVGEAMEGGPEGGRGSIERRGREEVDWVWVGWVEESTAVLLLRAEEGANQESRRDCMPSLDSAAGMDCNIPISITTCCSNPRTYASSTQHSTGTCLVTNMSISCDGGWGMAQEGRRDCTPSVDSASGTV